MTQVPQKWQKMLKDLRAIDPIAVLAGGAIRDLICHKRPRDLDFWVGNTNGLRNDFFELMRSWGSFVAMKMGKQDEYGTGNIVEDENLIVQVWTIKPHRWLPVRWQTTINVIWCEDWEEPLELVEKFDFGLCMVAYDGTNIIRSRHFDHDLENKCFTLRRAVNPSRMEKSRQRYERKFRRKYGWPMELSGMARLDQMLAGFHRAAKPQREIVAYD